jgi:DNA invertase Pin-like site-specific DNA recombinase
MTSTNNTNTAQTPRVYSYIRWSTPEQSKGDSLRRQTDAARRWAGARGYEMDEATFSDAGVSAFYGRNLADGALGAFLGAVRDGAVPRGSFLIVESLDRLSRQTVNKAARTLERIVEEGVNVVDLEDNGRIYTEATFEEDPMAFLIMAIRFMRSNAESRMKAFRLKEAYDNKRAAAANGAADKPFTRMLPAWLRWDADQQRHVAIEERAAVVGTIFGKADSGWGQHRIAHWLTAQGFEPFGIGKRRAAHWHRSYVRKLLTNPAVIGTFTPHRAHRERATGKRWREPLEAIENYWPAVVDREMFDRVSARTKATAARGRHAGRETASIFAGVLKCCRCGGTVTRMSKGRWVYLVCSKGHARGDCKRQAVRYHDVEEAMLQNVEAIVREAPRGSSTEEIEQQIMALEDGVVEELRWKVDALVDELAESRGEAVRSRLRDAESELKTAQEELRQLRAERETLAGPAVLRRLERLRGALTARPLNVQEANASLKEALERIVMDPERSRLELYWRHAPHEHGYDYVMFNSGRHSKLFGEAPASNVEASRKIAKTKPFRQQQGPSQSPPHRPSASPRRTP